MLRQLGAYCHPDLAQSRLPPRESDLAGHGHLNMKTNMGCRDVLCEVPEALRLLRYLSGRLNEISPDQKCVSSSAARLLRSGLKASAALPK